MKLHDFSIIRIFLLVLVAAVVPGCEPPVSSSATKALEQDGRLVAAESSDARKLLDEVASTYAQAKTYEDVAELFVEADVNGHKDSSPGYKYSVAFERPNRIRVYAFHGNAVSDGKQIHGTVEGIEQVLTLPAPAELEIENVLGDAILAEALGGGVPGPLPVLRLLLGDKSLPGFGAVDKVALLADAKLGDETCQRVEATTAAGKTVYWIDPKTHLLKRLEFATDEIVKKQQGSVENMKIWADFKSGKVNDEIAENAFEFESPPNAQLVRKLMAPPPAAPSPLLGQSVSDFSFDDLETGKTVDRASLEGKVAVFDFWATWCGWCFRGLPNVQKVYDKFKDNDSVAIFAVDTDDEGESDETVQKKFVEEKLTIPIARDRKNFNKEVFGVEGLPTMVVIDGKGTIQHVHVGYDPNLEAELTDVIDRLLKGENVAKGALEKHEAERRKYEQELNEAIIGTTSTLEVPQSQIAERELPTKLKLAEQWTTTDVALSGNILVVPAGESEPSIYVLSGSRAIVPVSADGKLQDPMELEIPDNLGVSTLRTAADADGNRYFAAFANTQQQVYLYDADWKKLLAYPDSQHAGLSDVQLGDLAGNGQPELILGYWGVVGIQAVGLGGERVWSNRQLENVTRMAITDANSEGTRRLLCVNGRDFIAQIDAAGKATAELKVPGKSLYSLITAELDGAAPAEMLALSSGELGVMSAIGLAEDGKVLWEYALPRGLHAQPIELISAGVLPGAEGAARNVWILAGADGSVHFLTADGELIDKFHYGEELTGIATAIVDGKPLLLVASTKSLTGWSVELP